MRRLMRFSCILCHFSSISSGNGGQTEGNGKVCHRPPRNIDVTTNWPPHDKTLQNFSSNACLIIHSRSHGVRCRLMTAHVLVSSPSPLLNHPQNLAIAIQNPIIPPPNKEETHKTRETFLQSPAYYHAEVAMIRYQGYCTVLVRFYPHICQFYRYGRKMKNISRSRRPSSSPFHKLQCIATPNQDQGYYNVLIDVCWVY